MPPIVTNTHLLEMIKLLISGINKSGEEQDKMEERMEEWFDALGTEVEEVQDKSDALQKCQTPRIWRRSQTHSVSTKKIETIDVSMAWIETIDVPVV